MILDYTINPTTKVKYTFPRAQIKLTVPNTRRNPVFVVPGGGGPINPKGNAAFDREPNIIALQFRVTPRDDGQTFTQARNAFVHAVDHGKPQSLFFLDDDGKYWVMNAALVSDPLEVDINAPRHSDFRVEWVALSDLLAAPAVPGEAVFGSFKFGHAKKFGASLVSYPLTANPAATIALDNSVSGATGSTTDPIFNFVGAYGPVTPSATAYIKVACIESGTEFYIFDTWAAGDIFLVDLAARRVLKNGSPVFGLLGRPLGQRTHLEIVSDVVNHIVISIVGTARSPLTGTLSLKWKPKKGF